jgi:uncharacterized OsmC-like protein
MATIKKVRVEAKSLEGFEIETTARQFKATIDQPISGGGKDAGPNPLEYLFMSLAGCIVTIGKIIAKQERLPVQDINVVVEGALDADVLMGKSNNGTRAGFNGVTVTTTINGDLTQEEKERLLERIDARCPISDNIHQMTPISFVVH